MKLQMFGTVGRATVPAENGRHGGRTYDNTSQSFFLDLTGRFLGRRRCLYKPGFFCYWTCPFSGQRQRWSACGGTPDTWNL